MKEKLLLSFFSLFSFLGYAQLPLEGFEGTFPPTNWAVFDTNVGGATNWTNNSNSCQGLLAAYMDRQNIGQGITSEEYLATRSVLIPTNGELRFFSKSSFSGISGTIYEVKLAPATSPQNLPSSYTITLATYTEDQLSAVFNVCDEKVISIPGAFINQNVYIAFVKKYTQPTAGLTGDRWILDNVQIIERCLDPTTLAATPAATTAALSWTGTGVTFEIENLLGNGTPTGIPTGTTSTNTFDQTGLTPNTEYCFYVRAVCTDSSSAWVGPFCYTTTTLPPGCGGNYVDSGGTTADYTNNEDQTVVICPVIPGEVVTVTFTSFDTEPTWDGIYVFNGNSIAAQQIPSANPTGNGPLAALAGAFWGTALPGPFTSSAANGCLTFRFRSDGSGIDTGWVANVTCGPPPSCPNPLNLTVTTLSTSASATWISNSTATTYNLIALPCGSPPPNATTTGYQTSITNTNAPITGLNPDTCYDFYIRDECGPNDFSAWISATNIQTQVTPPVCGGTFTDPGGSNANYADNLDYTVTICPTVPGEVVTVNFVSFNTEATWDGLYVFNGNSTGSPQIPSTNPTGNGPLAALAGAFWGNTVPDPFTSTSLDGCLTFRFRSDGIFNFAGWVANVTCGPPPSCPNPSAFTLSVPTSNSVNATWTSNSTATTYNIIALPCGSPAPNATTTGYQTSTTNTNAPITGLNPDTCYDIYVRDECSSTDFSIWIGPRTITTQIAPPVCGGVYTDPGGATNPYANNTDNTVTICPTVAGEIVTVTFTSFNTEATWDGLYVFDGDTILAPQIASTNPTGNGPLAALAGAFWGDTIPGPFSSSSLDGCLTFRFRSDFSFFDDGWIANVTCGPPPSCRKPNALTSSDVTLTDAVLGWTQLQNPDGSTANEWQVLILPAGSPAPTSTTTGWTSTTTNPFNATGLTQATCYDYYVRAICPPTDSSLWAGPSTFCTLIPNDNCDGAIIALTNPDQSCANISNGSLIGATPSQASSCANGNDVWFEFTATAANHSINLNNIAGGNAFNLSFAVYSGTCTNLTEIECVNDTDGILNSLTVGTTYYIQVIQEQGTTGNITFELCIGTIPPPLITNDNVYTTVQLVEDVLFNSTCATVTNVTSSTGSNFGSTNGIGYFDRNGSNFPFEDGVVLTSGSITNVPGPNTTVSSDGTAAWVGDTDLEAIILAATGNPMNSRNASKLEFDFVPLVDTISFDFIFASEEYGTFQCTFSDAFAFLLTNLNTGVTTNLAVVPTTTIPISVVTIRDNAFNAGCTSENAQYFGDFYQLPSPPGVSPLAAPANFNGTTIPMTASSAVIPGQQYHIKLVVADRQDNILDSAVFLEGGSFNFGLELGIDFLISSGNALCAGNTNQLVSDLDPTLYTFVWSNQNGVIPGENGPTLLINQTGTYTLTATLNNTTCTATDTIIVEYYDPIILQTPNNLTGCNSSGFAQFTLSQNNASVLGTYPAAQHTVTYHLTQADATAGINPLPNLYTNIVAFSQTIYARVTNVAGCLGTSSFNLIVQDLTPQFTITPETTICEGSSGTISVTPINFNLADATYSWTFNSAPLSFTTSTITVGLAGTYTVTVNNSGCTASSSTTIIVTECLIGIYASAVWMQDCTTPNDGKFFNTSGSGADLINQDGSLFTMNYGIHVQNSNTLILRGAEVKTQKSGTSNVCDARMNYRIFPTGNTPGAFNPWNLPFFSDCNTGTNTFINGGGPCITGQQKWQCISAPGCTAPLDLTALAPGNYTIQVFYDINGSFNTNTGCSDNVTLDNGGNYYTATFTIQAPVVITGTDPLTCNGNNGTITISNLIPNQSYSITYSDDTVTVGPNNFTSNGNGEIVISGLNAGIYANFNFGTNGCNTTTSNSVTLTDPGLPQVTVNNPVVCSGDSTTVTATPAVPGNYTYVWTVPAGFPNPGNVASFTTNVVGNYTVVITPVTSISLCNLDFETPTVSGTFPTLLNENVVPCWDTTAQDGIMEFWPSPNYENVLAYQGSQFIEMNGNFPATIFQDFTTEPGATLNISLAHRGRQGSDTIGVEVGPVGGPYTNLGTFTDGNTAWVQHNLSYLVPLSSGTNYSLRFVSISSAGGSPSVGNYLDAISVSTVQCSSLPTTGIVSLLPSVTLTLTSANENQTLCINNSIAPISYTSVNATDILVTGLPNGVTGTFTLNELIISGTPTESGIFNYTVTTQGGCNILVLTGTITVNPESTITLTSANDNQSVCINTPIVDITYSTTDATGATIIGLPTGVSGSFVGGIVTITGTPIESGIFNYTVTTTSNCATANLTGTITVNPDVTLILTSGNDNQTVCINTSIGSIVYTAGNATNVTVTGLPNGLSGSYSSGVFTISGSPTELGTFTYTVSTTSQCGNATLTGTIVVNPNVTLSLLSGNTNQTVCINTAISNIEYQSGNGATGITVTGLPNGVTGTFDANQLTISGTPTQSGTFNYTVTTVGGCSSTSLTGSIVVNSLVTPSFNFGTNITLCPGIIAPVLPSISSNNINGTWSPSVISNTTSGVYTFTPNTNECATTTTLNVTVEVAFSFEITGNCIGNSYFLTVPVLNGFNPNTSNYVWTINGNIVSNDQEFNVTAYLSSTNQELPILVTLTITSSEGCSNVDTFNVTSAFCQIQNGISPNNDGKNEFFDLEDLNVSKLNIFNRYGTIVYSRANYTNQWVGQSDKGDELPDGTYYYVIEFNDNQAAKTGWIYINRQKQ